MFKITKASSDPTWVQVYGKEGKTTRILLTDIGFEVGDVTVRFLGD